MALIDKTKSVVKKKSVKKVKDASLVNGMLKVFLENIIPDHKKPRKVSINTAKEETKEATQLLNE